MKNIFHFLIVVKLIDLSLGVIETPKIVKNCFVKMFNNSQFIICYKDVNNKWNINQNGTPPESIKVICCSNWDYFKCLEKYESNVCAAEEVKAAEKYRQDYNKVIESEGCKDFKQNSNKCVN